MEYLDSDNEFIFFDTHDEFGLALDLNNTGIEIYVLIKSEADFMEKCSKCTGKFHYIYQCLHCKDLVMCKRCFKLHSEDKSHYGILEKSRNFQIHPYFYRELNNVIEKEFQDVNVANIGSYFQKLIGSYGVSFVDDISNFDESSNDTPKKNNEFYTLNQEYSEAESANNQELQSLNLTVDEAWGVMRTMGFGDSQPLKAKLTEYGGDIPKTIDWLNRQINMK